jgi:transposase-like protein
MKRRRHTPEQIIRKLREADRLLAEGHEVPEVAKQLEISEATYHRWRAQYGEQALSFACRSAAVRPVPASNAAAAAPREAVHTTHDRRSAGKRLA